MGPAQVEREMINNSSGLCEHWPHGLGLGVFQLCLLLLFATLAGPEFESRIRQNEQNNAKFNFLTPGDPYHAYYQHKVKECREGRGGKCLQ